MCFTCMKRNTQVLDSAVRCRILSALAGLVCVLATSCSDAEPTVRIGNEYVGQGYVETNAPTLTVPASQAIGLLADHHREVVMVNGRVTRKRVVGSKCNLIVDNKVICIFRGSNATQARSLAVGDGVSVKGLVYFVNRRYAHLYLCAVTDPK